MYDNHCTLSVSDSLDFNEALLILKKLGCKVLLTHIEKRLVCVANLSEVNQATLAEQGITPLKPVEQAPSEPEEAPLPPPKDGDTYREGVDFDIRDEPETFDDSIHLYHNIEHLVELSHPIVGSAQGKMNFDVRTRSLVNTSEIKLPPYDKPFKTEIKTLKIKFLNGHSKGKVKYIDCNHGGYNLILSHTDSVFFCEKNIKISYY